MLPIPGPAKDPPQQRVTRAQSSRAAQEAKKQEAAAAAVLSPANPLEEGASPGSADPLVFLGVSFSTQLIQSMEQIILLCFKAFDNNTGRHVCCLNRAVMA